MLNLMFEFQSKSESSCIPLDLHEKLTEKGSWITSQVDTLLVYIMSHMGMAFAVMLLHPTVFISDWNLNVFCMHVPFTLWLSLQIAWLPPDFLSPCRLLFNFFCIPPSVLFTWLHVTFLPRLSAICSSSVHYVAASIHLKKSWNMFSMFFY